MGVVRVKLQKRKINSSKIRLEQLEDDDDDTTHKKRKEIFFYDD